MKMTLSQIIVRFNNTNKDENATEFEEELTLF